MSATDNRRLSASRAQAKARSVLAMSQITKTYKIRHFRIPRSRLFGRPRSLRHARGPDARTNSNKITYWLDRSYREFGDECCVLGFGVDRRVVGFAEVAFLKSSRVLFFDYLVLHKAHRSRGEYFQFAQLLQEWIDQQQLEFDFTVAEVSFESGTTAPSDHSVLPSNCSSRWDFWRRSASTGRRR